MTVTASAHGTRIDCDVCGTHVAALGVGPEELRRRQGFVHAVDGLDYCDRCARVAAELVEPLLQAGSRRDVRWPG
jgi:hypothetical protein